MRNTLIDFWQQAKFTSAPFIHPKDFPFLYDKKRYLIEGDPTNFKSYVSGQRFGDYEDARFHLSLYPSPYIGNLENAEIVILLLNGGFEHCDYWAEYERPEFRRRAEQTLSQSFKGIDFPFWPLDPEFCWHTGFRWWERKLRAVISERAKKKFDGNYLMALKEISRKLACIELIPYHSMSFQEHKLTKLLPSVKAARNYVKSSLIPDAEAGKRTVIVTRQLEGWELQSQKDSQDLVLYRKGQTRAASLGLDTTGGKAILRRLEIA